MSLDIQDWMLDGVYRVEGEPYKGGTPSSEDWVFPKRNIITNFIRENFGEGLLDEFDESEFGKNLGEGGIGRNSGRLHKVNARGLVDGWMHNRAVWNKEMEPYHFESHFSFKGRGLDSTIEIAARLFAHRDNPLPYEVAMEVLFWLGRGGNEHETISELIELTGMTRREYAVALWCSDYSIRYISPYGAYYRPDFNMVGTFLQTKSTKMILSQVRDVMQAVSDGGGDTKMTWAWTLLKRKDTRDVDVVLSEISKLSAITSPLLVKEVMDAGISSPSMIESVLDGTIDIELARSVELA